MPIATPTRAAALAAFALALLAPPLTARAAPPPAANSPAASAQTFVRTMAQGHFTAAERSFTAQMRQAAPPRKLRDLWNRLTQQFGEFQKTSGQKVAHKDGYTVVIVGAEFKFKTIGLQVAFDSAHQIAGLYVVPAP